MNIAILSDVHSNSYALKEVLKEIKGLGITRVFLLGDITGYYYQTCLCLRMLNEFDWKSIQGNHENLLRKSLTDENVKRSYHQKYGSSLEYAKKELTPDELNLLTNLPLNLEFRQKNCTAIFCHGTPWNRDHYLYRDSAKEKLDRALLGNHQFVFIGHNHYQFIYQKEGKQLVSVGSVGQNRESGGIAQWAVLNVNECSIELKSTPYQTEQLRALARKVDPHLPYLENVLVKGKE
jgi:predicted phosphodiesterase